MTREAAIAAIETVPVKIKRLSPGAVIPKYATDEAACFDLVAVEEAYIFPGGCVPVSLGFAVSILPGFKIEVYARSGNSSKTPLLVPNAPGQIDSDYRGTVKVLLRNTAQAVQVGHTTAINLDLSSYQTSSPERKAMGCSHGLPNGVVHVRKGDRIAQGAIERVIRGAFQEVDELDDTDRGEGGFGSTGVV